MMMYAEAIGVPFAAAMRLAASVTALQKSVAVPRISPGAVTGVVVPVAWVEVAERVFPTSVVLDAGADAAFASRPLAPQPDISMVAATATATAMHVRVRWRLRPMLTAWEPFPCRECRRR